MAREKEKRHKEVEEHVYWGKGTPNVANTCENRLELLKGGRRRCRVVLLEEGEQMGKKKIGGIE